MMHRSVVIGAPNVKHPCMNHRHHLVLWLAAAALLVGEASAQSTATIAGRVTDHAGQPLTGVHVYIAGSMIGTVSRPDGQFALEGLTTGAHRLVASMIGFEVQAVPLTITRPGRYEVDFALVPVVYELGEVSVSAREQRRWLSRLKRFERVFIGTSSFADSVRILNPEVLDFRLRLGRLTASAREPLKLENRALGYLIRYDLTVFEALPHRVRYDGEPLFSELEPGNEEEASIWTQNRERIYRGSQRHLLRSMISGTERDEGFSLIHRPDEGPRARRRFMPTGLGDRRHPIRGSDILRPADEPGYYRLRFAGLLEVIYEGEPEDERFPFWEWTRDGHARPRPDQQSELFLTSGPTLIDDRGELSDPFGLTRMGYLAFRRVAMLLPVEYGLD
jgi:hypothetical protein